MPIRWKCIFSSTELDLGRPNDPKIAKLASLANQEN
uniref:Uncharacterized protein n=1 Tax=Arundo donax TaxID=35708 RepID=A0A0A8Z2G8_ARUDO